MTELLVIKVDKHLSVKLQKYLFSKYFMWRNSHKTISHINAKYLCVNLKTGIITKQEHTHTAAKGRNIERVNF